MGSHAHEQISRPSVRQNPASVAPAAGLHRWTRLRVRPCIHFKPIGTTSSEVTALGGGRGKNTRGQ